MRRSSRHPGRGKATKGKTGDIRAVVDYDALAPVYERVFGPEAAEGTWQVLTRLMLPHLRTRARVLELCCGTGEITARLLRAGCRVTAVDRSPAMLAYAHRRAPGAEIIASDIRTFTPCGSYDAALCAYNSLPHITDTRELETVFRMVRGALVTRGLFLFDLYPEEAFPLGWHGTHVAGDCVLESDYDAAHARAVTHVHWRDGAAELKIRCYTRRQLWRRLRAAGFTAVEYHAGGRATDGRLFWLCSTTRGESESECGGRQSGPRPDRWR